MSQLISNISFDFFICCTDHFINISQNDAIWWKIKKIRTVHNELLYILHFQLIQVFYPSDFFSFNTIYAVLHNKQLLNEDISVDLLTYIVL